MAMQIDGNVGGTDRIVRMALGGVMVVAAALGVIPAWGFLGIFIAATGYFEMCPVYSILGYSTFVRKVRRKASKPKDKYL
jgi:hypothetical protein